MEVWTRPRSYLGCTVFKVLMVTAALVFSHYNRYPQVLALDQGQLYPFGLDAGDRKLQTGSEDVSSPEFRLKTEVKFFSRKYGGIYVNENGLVSFLTEIPSYFNIEFPLDYPLIAGFYSDVDTRGSGSVWYRSSVSGTTVGDATLARSTSDVREAFGNRNFRPSEVFVATWDRVGHFDSSSGDQVNTFQIIISSDDQVSYATLLYPKGQLKWLTGAGKNRNLPDGLAQAGIISGDGRHTLMPFSGRDQIRNLDKWSNVGREGVWMYQLGLMAPDENIPPIPTHISHSSSQASEMFPETDRVGSCANLGHSMCHSNSACKDHQGSPRGYCCSCLNGWFGDGRTCLPRGEPQRVSGRVHGSVNGVDVVDQDLHCYVVTKDGRTYTAISRVDRLIGFDAQALIPTGVPVAWLFSLPLMGSKNGFALTGGRFNYTADIQFLDSGHRSTVRMSYQGLDAFGYIKAHLRLDGTVPPLVSGRSKKDRRVLVTDYEETFSRVRPGLLRSGPTEHQFGVEGRDATYRYIASQTIEFDEDPACNPSEGFKFVSARNYIVYDDKEQVVRFAMTSKVEPQQKGDEKNPCLTTVCPRNSRCVLVNGQPDCACGSGFRMAYSDPHKGGTLRQECVDEDECLDPRKNSCLPKENMDCLNVEGGYRCVCRSGHAMVNGKCLLEQTCDDLDCVEDAECLLLRDGRPTCQCLPGFQGDGLTQCKRVASDVTLRGRTLPQNTVLEYDKEALGKNGVEDIGDLGPMVAHQYEVGNHGPNPVGDLRIEVHWPLKYKGQTVTYFTEMPTLSYDGGSNSPGGHQGTKECDLLGVEDYSTVINPIGLMKPETRRRKRDQGYDEAEDQGPYDYDYDESLKYSAGKIEGLSPEDKALLDQYDAGRWDPVSPREKEILEGEYGEDGANYDYFNLEDPNSMLYDDYADYNVPGNISGDAFPVAERVRGSGGGLGMAPRKGLRGAPQGRPGDRSQDNLVIVCNAFLNQDERAIVTVKSYLYLKNFLTADEVSLTSSALLIADPEASNVLGDSKVSVTTEAKAAKRPSYRLAPGQGPKCGGPKVTCDKYADCHASFTSAEGEDEGLLCRCLTGFKGNGTSCTRTDRQDPWDCRLDQSRCGQGHRCLFDRMSGLYRCQCQNSENGHDCSQPDEGSSSPSTTQPAPRPTEGPPEVLRKDPTTDGSSLEPDCSLGMCTCPPRYLFDGTKCRLNVKGQDVCRTDSDCGKHSSCKFNQSKGKFQCICHEGYIGDGLTCNPDGCIDKNNCHEAADCALDLNLKRHRCVCKKGFHGDGLECKADAPSAIGCNIVNNCGKNARCELIEDQHRCICHKGFEGDGYDCKASSKALSCRSDASICASDADCVAQSSGQYVCQCRHGFTGDGLTCQARSKGDQGEFLLASQGMALVKVPFNASTSNPGYPVYMKAFMTATGLAVDCLHGQVYWADTTGKAIRRSDYDGKNVQDFMATSSGSKDGMRFPESVGIDWLARNIYWTDSGKRTVEVASLDYTPAERIHHVLFDEHIRNPRGLALHPSASRLFWTDWDRAHPRIEASNLDGSQRSILVDTDLGMPNSLTVDFEQHRLCWTDGGSSAGPSGEVMPKIECIGINGGGRQVLIRLKTGDRPFGLALRSNYVYWTDWSNQGINGAELDSGARLGPLPHVLQAVDRPLGIVSVPQECPRTVGSVCERPLETCGQGQMCLPRDHRSRSCFCKELGPRDHGSKDKFCQP